MGFDGSWSDFRSGFDSENYDFRETWNQLTNWRGAPDEKAMAAIQLMAALHKRTFDRPDLAERVDRGFPTRGMAHSLRSEEHTSELQSLMRISYAVFCLKK